MLTKKLGEAVADAGQAKMPGPVREAAKLSVIDTIAVMMAGRCEKPVALVRQICEHSTGGAVEVHGFDRVGPSTAALINGVAAHILDYDDVALRGHPGAVMVPALLALGAHVKSPGSRLLDAYAAGYQVWWDLVFRDEDIHHLKGWHPTGVFGAVGAAAACGALLQLDSRAASHAIGLAASMSGGIMANFGSMAKPLHAGRAAQAGVMAASLAQIGFTAGEDALEHDQGFLKAVSPNGRVDRGAHTSEIDEWALGRTRTSIKKYPTCYYTHRGIDAALTLVERLRDRMGEIEKIEVRMSREHATVLRNHQPQDGLSAKFSIEFALACALVHGKVSLSELRDDIVRSEAVQRLMGKVEVIHAKDYSETWKGAAAADQVFVFLRNGETIASAPQVHAIGDAACPLEKNHLERKFIECVHARNAPLDADRLLERLWNLEDQEIHRLWE